MKLKTLIQNSGDPTAPSVDAVYNRLIRKSSMGSFIMGCLAEETTEAAIIEQLRALYDVPGEEVVAAVSDILNKLREAGALDE